MRHWLLACVLSGVGLGPRMLEAQHPRPAIDGEVQPPGSCDYCHAAHVGEPTRFTLRLGAGRGADVASWLGTQAPGAGAVSASCVRCHLGPSLRERQPEMARFPAGGPWDGARHLALAPSASHPLGDVTVLVPRSGGRRGAPSRRIEPALQFDAQARVIECTECHDPHDRLSPIPDAGEQRLICGACHGAQYAGPDHVSLACSDCHDLHQGQHDTRLLRVAAPELLCISCHAATGLPAASAGSGRRRVSSPTAPPIGAAPDAAHGAGRTCTECHVPHSGGSRRPVPR